MSGSLSHSPAEVIRQLLIDLGVGTVPSALGNWPIHVAREPDKPDSAITVYNTTGRDHGRTMNDGERQEHLGIQVRVRDMNHDDGFEKAQAVAMVLDQTVRLNTVTVSDRVGTGSATYTVYSVSRTTGVIIVGEERPDSRRNIFTINAVVSLRQTT